MSCRPTFAFAAALATLLALSSAAHAANTVYRCNVAGRTVYADEPCGTKAREVAVDDSRTDGQRAQAKDAAKREAAMGKQMRRERLQEEKVARSLQRQGPSNARPTQRTRDQASVEYSNASGKVTKTLKPKKGPGFDDSMPIYIDVPKAK